MNKFNFIDKILDYYDKPFVYWSYVAITIALIVFSADLPVSVSSLFDNKILNSVLLFIGVLIYKKNSALSLLTIIAVVFALWNRKRDLQSDFLISNILNKQSQVSSLQTQNFNNTVKNNPVFPISSEPNEHSTDIIGHTDIISVDLQSVNDINSVLTSASQNSYNIPDYTSS